jgi:bifunctional UDP-N-acetylglucosamine pyrophosphorylase/glucosamine-1-phosphate N-acetyltransferase
VVVLYGDMPLLSGETLERLMLARARAGEGMAMLVAVPDKPRGFGRVIRAGGGAADAPVVAIVEERDATPEQLAVREVNVGVYAFPGPALAAELPRLEPKNAQGEYYLTDVVAAFVDRGLPVVAERVDDPVEAVGVNTISHLAEARRVVQERILEHHMARGVRVEDPSTTYVDFGVEIGAGTRLLPCTVVRSGVKIGEHCEVGPFSHLRVGTVLEDRAEVGNFTETKKAVLGSRSKAKHLSYLGDVRIGARTNIGAGTIVANYDGTHKHPTVIGDDAFVGSGSVLVAPTTVGNGSLTGAGAIVTRATEIPDHEAWVGVPARFLKKLRDEPRETRDSRTPGGAGPSGADPGGGNKGGGNKGEIG